MVSQACAVDPGSVSTAIYRDSRLFSRQPLKWLIQTLYAPPWDGAAAVVAAASAPTWGPPASQRGDAHSSVCNATLLMSMLLLMHACHDYLSACSDSQRTHTVQLEHIRHQYWIALQGPTGELISRH